MDKGHYQVKKLPPSIKECWFYTGKRSSIHIVLSDIYYELSVDGIKHKVTLPIPQVNIDLPSIKKASEPNP